MRKERYRDYAVAAITDWLGAGEPGVDACKRMYKGATRADMIAAACAVSMVTKTAPDAGEAVRAVYGNMAGGARRGEITARVVRFAMDRYVGERQVWEWLARVRREFAQARGLRCERMDTNNARKT